jgi:hypothetical protein
MGVKYSNNATTTLPAPITDAATSITVTSTTTFPTVTGGDYAYVTLASSTATEVVKCTDITGNVLTVIRAQEGTTASAFTTDDRVEVRVTTAMLTDALAETVANAASSAAAAATSETNAATSYDDFDDRWLGNKASDPALDNDSNALLDGAAYFNTTNNVLMVYDLGNTSWLRTTPTTADQTNINLVQANQTNIDTCATDIAKIIKTADDLNEAISEIETVANDLNETSSEIDTVANSIANVDIVGTNISNVNTVAGISANTTTVAGISTDVTTTAGKATEIGLLGVADVITDMGLLGLPAVITDMDLLGAPGVIADIATVSSNVANVNLVGPISSDVTTVAGISTDVTAVADSTAAGHIATVSANITDVDSFANRYRISSSEPVSNNDAGDLHFNTTTNELRSFGTVWQATAPSAADQLNINVVAGDIVHNEDLGLITEALDTTGDSGDIAIVADNITEIQDLVTDIAHVSNVGGSITNVNTVAGSIANVNAVAADATDIGVVAGKETEIGRLGTAGAVADMVILGTTDVVNDMNVLGTPGNVTNMNTLSGISGNITTVSGIAADVTAVAADSSDIGTVATSISGVNTVAGISANVTTVANDGTDIGIVAGDTIPINTVAGDTIPINTVAGDTTEINILSPISANVTTVAGISANVSTVAGISTNVTTVAGISTDVTAVAADATDIGAVAAKATEIGRLGTADAVADLAILGTADIVTDMNVLGTPENVTAMDTLGTANNVTNMATVAADIADINTVAGVASGIDFFTDRYRVGATDPSTGNDAGDLFFNTTSNELRSYGTSWQATAPDAVNQNNINIVAGELLYHEDLGLITDAVLTASATGDVATVAASIDEVDRLGTVDAVADMAILSVPDVVADMAILGDAANVTAMANCSANVTDINRYSDEYVIAATQPGSPSEGDLWYDDTNNILKYYNGSIFAAIAAGIADVQSDAAPTLGGTLDADNNNVTNCGTIDGSNLQIDFGGLT